MAVEAILVRCSLEKLAVHFSIAAFDSTEAFLYQIATKRNKLLKGGVPDKAAAARNPILLNGSRQFAVEISRGFCIRWRATGTPHERSDHPRR